MDKNEFRVDVTFTPVHLEGIPGYEDGDYLDITERMPNPISGLTDVLRTNRLGPMPKDLMPRVQQEYMEMISISLKGAVKRLRVDWERKI